MEPKRIALIIDLVAIVAAVLFIWQSSIKGFLVSFIDFLGYIVSVIMAGYFSSAAANLLYDKYLNIKITTALDSTIRQATSGLNWTDSVSLAVNNLPMGIRDLVSSVFKNLTDETQQFLNENAFSIAAEFINNNIKPMIISLLTSMFFVLIFSILLYLIREASKYIKGLDKISVVSTVDHVLGGVIGFFKIFLILLIVFTAADLFVVLSSNNSTLINADMLNKSLVYSLISQINPFI